MTDSPTKRLLAALANSSELRQERAIAFLEDQTVTDISAPRELEPYLTLKQLARMLNFHPSTLWRWHVPKHNLAGRPRFRASEVVAYLSSDAFKKHARDLRQSRRTRSTT